jgi:hypothetical protein
LLPELRANRRSHRLRPLVHCWGLRALEGCGILSWVHRLKRVREPCPDLLGDNGWRWRVLRTSNAYHSRLCPRRRGTRPSPKRLAVACQASGAGSLRPGVGLSPPKAWRRWPERQPRQGAPAISPRGSRSGQSSSPVSFSPRSSLRPPQARQRRTRGRQRRSKASSHCEVYYPRGQGGRWGDGGIRRREYCARTRHVG